MEGWIGRGGRRCPKEAEASGGFGGKGGGFGRMGLRDGGGFGGRTEGHPIIPPIFGGLMGGALGGGEARPFGTEWPGHPFARACPSHSPPRSIQGGLGTHHRWGWGWIGVGTGKRGGARWDGGMEALELLLLLQHKPRFARKACGWPIKALARPTTPGLSD